MFRVFSRVAESFCDLMTSSLKITSILGVIIPLLSTWTFSYTALASATPLSSLHSTISLDALETTTLLPGQLAIFSCHEEHMPDTLVQWLKDDEPISKRISTSQKTYKRRKRKSRKRSATLWHSRHRSRSVRSLNTSVSSSGTTFSDIKNTSDSFSAQFSASQADFTVLRNGSLQIENVKLSHAGKYKCFIEDSLGKVVRREFSLIVTNLPQCTIQPSTRSAHQYGAARFHCSTNSAIDVIYSWSKDGKMLPKTKKYIQLANGALQIFNLSHEDAGEYKCHVKFNGGESSSDAAQLKILPQNNELQTHPTLLVEPQDLTAYSPYGNGAIFECLVEEPNVTYSWKRPEGEGKKICPYQICPISYHGTNNLVLGSSINDYYDGEYMCIVRYQSSKTILFKKKARLNLFVKPTANLEKTDEARLSSEVTLSCSVTGFPNVDVTWIKNGELIDADHNYRLETQDYDTGAQEQHYLKIISVEISDNGYYQCVAANGAGSVAAWTYLNVTRYEYVPSPKNVTATALNQKEILVQWDRVTHANIKGYKITCVKVSDATLVLDEPVGPTTSSINLTELHPFTEYRITVKAFSSIDPSDPSDPVIVRTMEGVPCHKVDREHLQLYAVNSTTILVSWRSLPIEGRCGVITEYEVNCNDLYKITVPASQAIDDKRPVTEYALITGLTPGEEYPISVTPATRVGKGEETGYPFVRLPQNLTQRCNVASSAFVFLTGYLNLNGLNGDLGLMWKLRKDASADNITVVVVSSDNQLSRQKILSSDAEKVIFEELDPRKAYLVTVGLVVDGKHQCEKRKIAVFLGRKSIGGKEEDNLPFDISGETPTQACVDLKWSFDDEKIEKFHFVIRYNLRTASRKDYKYVNTTKTQIRICGLKTWSDYEFAVASTSNPLRPYDNMTFAEMKKFVKTLEGEPGPPAKLMCTDSELGRANCHWVSPKWPNGEITSYTLEYCSDKNATWKSVTSSGMSISVECLEPGTTHYFRVYANNKAGRGEPSAFAKIVMANYDASLQNCTFEYSTESPPADDHMLLYIAVAAGIFVFCVLVCVVLCCIWLPRRRMKVYRSYTKKRNMQKDTIVNGHPANGSGSSTKQNGHYVPNGVHLTQSELLDEQKTNLLANGVHTPHQNGHPSTQKNGYKKHDIVKKNGYHKDPAHASRMNGTTSPKCNAVREENGTKVVFSFDTLLLARSEKNKPMAVPESNQESSSPNNRLILSVPIPKHASMSCDSSSAGSRDQHCSTSCDSRTEDL